MTRDERIEQLLAYSRGEGPSPLHRQHQYQERDWYSRTQVRGDEGRSDWGDSSFGGRSWGGSKFGGGREV